MGGRSRHWKERSGETIQDSGAVTPLDCFASLAMTVDGAAQNFRPDF
jgi:hypothetical protein